MPGKEAAVEVETNGVVPAAVTKEIPKCDDVSLEVKGKKEVDTELVKSSDTPVVPDSAESKPQDTEVTSTDEQKADIQDSSIGKTDKEAAAESANGSTAKPVEKSEASRVDEKITDGESKAESVVSEASKELKESEAAQSESKQGSEAEAKPIESADTNVSEAEVGSAEPVESKTEPMETEAKSAKPEEVESMEHDAKSSEAEAKPLPADDEKIIVEKDSETKSATLVTGSDEVKDPKAQESVTDGCSSADSSSEKKSEGPSSSEIKTDEKPGSSSSTLQPDLETQISELKKNGLALYVRKDFCAAADAFGKVLEVAAPLYGEMSEKLAETYFLYGSAMYEYGKAENEVLGEKVKEKDADSDSEEGMDLDVKEDVPAGEDSAEKRPTTPSGYGETENADDDHEEPADETVAGDAEDEDSFRVAWEMLELAKATFLKAGNKQRLADTLIKLGEVGIETDNVDAIGEMVEGLKIRKEIYADTHRIIPETHFTIGIAYAAFDKYDEAIEHFTHAKDCLERRIEELSKSEKEEDRNEVEEMKSLLPEIQEKIEDTKESKADKEKMKKKLEGELLKETPFPAPSEDKPVSNITHLVKRKRKVDDILPERAAKQSRTDGAEASGMTDETDEVQSTQPPDSMEIAESKKEEEEPKVVDSKSELPEETNSEAKGDEAMNAKENPGNGPQEEDKAAERSDNEKINNVVEPAKTEAKKPEEPLKTEEAGAEKDAETVKPEEAKPEKAAEPTETAEAKNDAPEKMEE